MKLLRGALFSVVLVGCQRSGAEPLVFGHVAPLTGPGQSVDQREIAAVRLAVDDANAVTGTRPVRMLHAGAADQPDGFAVQATRLLAVNRVSALIAGDTDAQLRQLAGPALAAPALLVSPADGHATALNSVTFTVGLDVAERARCLARYLIEDLRISSVATVTDSTSSSGELANGFARAFRDGERAVRETIGYRDGLELPGIARQISGTNPGAVLFVGPAADFLAFRDAFPATTTPPRFVCGGDEATLASLLSEPDRARDAIAATAFIADDAFDRTQDFVARFREKTGQPPDARAALAYDAAHLAIEAARRAGNLKPANWRDEFAPTADWECLTGPLRFTDEQGARRPVFVVQIQSGKAEFRRRFKPDGPATGN